ncbi:hypothetical protein ACN28S_19855 [Cystobacter fuscus]
MLTVRPARPTDAALLAPRLREADLLEIAAVTTEKPVELLERSIRCSVPCHAVLDEQGLLLALFGAAPDGRKPEAGLVWLLGSDELEKHAVTFLRQGLYWIERLHEHYSVLGNWIDARNEVHIRWLRWCGFQLIHRDESHGVQQRSFYEFVRIRGATSPGESSPDPTSRGA